jgi:hypothetical protein
MVTLTLCELVDRVYIKSPAATDWQEQLAAEWSYAHAGHRITFDPVPALIPDADGWNTLWIAAHLAVPNTTIVFGARLNAGPNTPLDAGGLRLPGVLLVSLDSRQPGPLSTLHHEILHEVWERLDPEATAILEAHGHQIRTANADVTRGNGRLVCAQDWIDQPGEAEAYSYQHWATGSDNFLGVGYPTDVIGIFERVSRGGYS